MSETALPQERPEDVPNRDRRAPRALEGCESRDSREDKAGGNARKPHGSSAHCYYLLKEGHRAWI